MIRINQSVPPKSGVYIFKNSRGVPIYIGKANNLRSRIKSYFAKNVPIKTKVLIDKTANFSWEVLGSEIDALIREAELIKQYRPKYNILMRDDKQYLYVGFTREEYPKIVITHQPTKNQIITDYIGPFTDAGALRTVLRSLRRIFPYCTCKRPHKTPCLNARIGRCLGYCCVKPTRLSSRFPRSPQRASSGFRPALSSLRSEPARFGLKTRFDDNLVVSYQTNIHSIKKILSGKNKTLVNALKNEMKMLSKTQRYEKAAAARNQIQALEHIFAHRSIIANDLPTERRKALRALAQLLHIPEIRRIEGYDISNIHGKHAYGSMVVFIDGIPAKNQYRIFKINLDVGHPSYLDVQRPSGGNDPAMIREVIARRLKHQEWPYPDVMLIDGGRAQFSAAQTALGNRIAKWQSDCPKIISLAKPARRGSGREEELYISTRKPPMRIKQSSLSLYHLLTHIRDEAHRFAIKHYRKAHRKNVLHERLLK